MSDDHVALTELSDAVKFAFEVDLGLADTRSSDECRVQKGQSGTLQFAGAFGGLLAAELDLGRKLFVNHVDDKLTVGLDVSQRTFGVFAGTNRKRQKSGLD